jgi:hypothetical protein
MSEDFTSVSMLGESFLHAHSEAVPIHLFGTDRDRKPLPNEGYNGDRTIESGSLQMSAGRGSGLVKFRLSGQQSCMKPGNGHPLHGHLSSYQNMERTRQDFAHQVTRVTNFRLKSSSFGSLCAGSTFNFLTALTKF